MSSLLNPSYYRNGYTVVEYTQFANQQQKASVYFKGQLIWTGVGGDVQKKAKALAQFTCKLEVNNVQDERDQIHTYLTLHRYDLTVVSRLRGDL